MDSGISQLSVAGERVAHPLPPLELVGWLADSLGMHRLR